MNSGRMTGARSRRVMMVVVVLLFVGASAALSGGPGQTVPAQEAGVGQFLTKNVFALTILLIFLVAIIGTFLKSRSKDKCMKDFEGYDVTIETADGRDAYGELRVYSNAVELQYALPRKAPDGNVETTFIFYDKQYNDLRRICRYSDGLTKEDVVRREKDLRRTSDPSVFRRMGRWLGNVANTFRDALLEAIGAAVASTKSAHPSSVLMTTQQARVSKIGESVVGYAARAYDPVLEKHIFDSVLVEELWGDQLLRHKGVLKEYTSSFIEVLDVELKGEFKFPLKAEERASMSCDYELEVEGGMLRVSNRRREPAVVKEVMGKDFKKDINLRIEGGESVSVDIGGELPEDAVVVLAGKRRGDILFPRARASVRYGSVLEDDAGTLR